jgi:hypothetical protein
VEYTHFATPDLGASCGQPDPRMITFRSGGVTCPVCLELIRLSQALKLS